MQKSALLKRLRLVSDDTQMLLSRNKPLPPEEREQKKSNQLTVPSSFRFTKQVSVEA